MRVNANYGVEATLHGGKNYDPESLKTPNTSFRNFDYSGGGISEGSRYLSVLGDTEIVDSLLRFGVVISACRGSFSGLQFRYRSFVFIYFPREPLAKLCSFLQFVRREDLVWRV